MSLDASDETLKILLRGSRSHPLEQLDDTDASLGLRTLEISKHRATYSDGWTHDLRPESCFYKRWFDFHDLGLRGWAIMFHIFDPVGDQPAPSEQFPGWVPPERVADADRWIARLNEAIRSVLAKAASTGGH